MKSSTMLLTRLLGDMGPLPNVTDDGWGQSLCLVSML